MDFNLNVSLRSKRFGMPRSHHCDMFKNKGANVIERCESLTSQRSRKNLRCRSRIQSGGRLWPAAEWLEGRQVPATLSFPSGLTPIVESQPTETVDRANDLGTLGGTQLAGATGTIGVGPAGAADVSWYHFTLDRPATVSLTAGATAANSTFRPVISLYNEDLYDFGDPLNPQGRRLLAQDQASTGSLANIGVTLGAGSYDVAVSGAGNLYFAPLMSGSGFNGETGDYNLLVAAQPLNLDPNSGPTLLASNPTPGASLGSSPLAIRLDLSGTLDASTIVAGTDVQLLFNPSGTFGDGNDVSVPLTSVNFSATVNELQLFPESALAPGYYKVVLGGNSASSSPVLANLNGVPLGADAQHPLGQDVTLAFQVTGIENGTGPADTLATAHNLGDVTQAGRVAESGALGNDPFYDPNSPDPSRNPGDQVDFYRFHVSGAGNYALIAEVFAGRIGSPLDPGVALYRVDPNTQNLIFVDGNNNSGNQATATDSSTPLVLDPALFANLTAGDYVLAVSTGFNTPSPLEGQPTDAPGLYNPEVSHSASGGFGSGPYVLNFEVTAIPTPPEVLATTPSEGDVLTTVPTELSVQFSEPVNLQQAAYQAYLKTTQSAVGSVYILAGDGTKYFPRFASIDRDSNTANFLMLDALPNGTYELHLSGSNGLTDLGGNPLTGNDPSGDYVVHFQVNAPARGTGSDPLIWTAIEPAEGDVGAQDLGVLFPHEFQSGVNIVRDPAIDPAAALGDTQDAFQFEVLQAQFYTFSVQGSPAVGSATLWLTDAQGNPVASNLQGNGNAIGAELAPGTYVIHLGEWTAQQAADLSYQLHLTFLGNADNPIPLVAGPSPAVQMRLATSPDIPSPAPSGGASVNNNADNGATGPVSPTPAYGPSGGEVGGGSTGSGMGTSLLGGSSIASSSLAMSSPSLIVLSVAPVGSLPGSTSGAGSVSTEVAFSLPSQAPSMSTMGQAVVSLVTTIQVIGSDDLIQPDDLALTQADAPAVGPEAVFNELPPGLAMAVEDLAAEANDASKKAPEVAAPALQKAEPIAPEPVVLAHELELSETGEEPPAEQAVSGVGYFKLICGGTAAVAGSIAVAILKRRAYRKGAAEDERLRDGAGDENPGDTTRLAIAKPMGRRTSRRRQSQRNQETLA